VLNVGIGPLQPGAEAYLCDARARFLWQFAELVLGLDASELAALRAECGELADASAVNALQNALAARAAACGKIWPRTPSEELLAAAKAVFLSWQSSRAKLYRRMRRIDDSLGTSVTVQQMVFGNRDAQSGSGVAFTRDPTRGERGLCGEFCFGGQGEELVAGRETGHSLQRWREAQPSLFAELNDLGQRLEATYHKVYEIEFTVEQGKLYVLQCRPALLTARASARVAVEMAQEGLLGHRAALVYAQSHGFDPTDDPETLAVRPDSVPIGHGLAVGGGVGIGRVALRVERAEEFIRAGEPVVFVAAETSPNLLPIMQRSAALITMRGGASSHAAVVARELGTPCIVGVGAEMTSSCALIGTGLQDGDWATVDGDHGAIYRGDVSERASRLTGFEQTLRHWAAEIANGITHEGEINETQG
jgi:pyruvate,orthophosphate dikinase